MKKLVFIVISLMVLMSVVYATAANEISEAGSRILGAIAWIGYAVSLGMILFIGIKYIVSSADGRANMKKSLVNWVIGAFIVFMATVLVSAVLKIIGVDGNTETVDPATKIVDTYSLN